MRRIIKLPAVGWTILPVQHGCLRNRIKPSGSTIDSNELPSADIFYLFLDRFPSSGHPIKITPVIAEEKKT
ncbi:MAG: hypothetical protein H6545_04275 [Bacteroidales bacterium]|jgi:hypothetical protein|nr:hypothetical protein [Bacteroidales bacterium]MCB9028318.1 hypothetical protein [Bacteroidales bacterium]HOO66992.1 hypothetical protein [Bacteroidales bacterium]HPE21786.1 hypothetical protein [Bacteroidales bacterium]HPJ05529.1 hypothetical protein [Bacteroidales bacterium]